MSEQWGLCKSCKWWQIEPDASIEDQTCGYCIEQDLQPFHLRITGNGGCNRFMAGKPARAEGSSEKPPAAVPQR
ncbi:META domain-containing protein [Bremerella sp. T1]|uniref:META domain-containing protein n=1 Tax=Bremerella sp. TYQ1 TaxID=3119568 RepID=UPI001CC960AF|nr:META domain-containing protein [Bremerella volcania]UBM34029.1 META domain-containing protein [Bremerella volcania]